MSISNIKNTKLRRVILLIAGPPLVVVVTLIDALEGARVGLKDTLRAFGAAWNGR